MEEEEEEEEEKKGQGANRERERGILIRAVGIYSLAVSVSTCIASRAPHGLGR